MDWVGFILQMVGAIYLFKKKTIAWVFLIISNILWVIYFFNYHPEMLSAIIQTILFLGLDIFGFWCWKRETKTKD